MARMTHTVAGVPSEQTVPDEAVDYFRTLGWSQVYDADQAAELKGAALEEALTVEHVTVPSGAKADEKRAALVEQTSPNTTPED